MLNVQTKIFNCEGATVTVITLNKRYVVEIFIPKEMVKEELQIKSNKIRIKFNLKKEYTESIRIKMEAEYDLYSSGEICVKNSARLKFEDDNCKGFIVLKPSAYISYEVLEKAFNIRCSDIVCNNGKKQTSSNYTNYLYNNVSKLYNGGLATPK